MKTLRLKNHNNKFACDYFGLIAPAPPMPITDIIQPFLIQDVDGNYPDFVAERITMSRFKAIDTPEMLSYLANGNDTTNISNPEQEVAFYLFKKV